MFVSFCIYKRFFLYCLYFETDKINSILLIKRRLSTRFFIFIKYTKRIRNVYRICAVFNVLYLNLSSFETAVIVLVLIK